MSPRGETQGTTEQDMRHATLTRIVLVGTALCVGVAGSARAQDHHQPAFAFREQLTPFVEQIKEALGADHERFAVTLDELVDQETDERTLRAEIGFGFSGNEAGDFSGVGPGNDTLFKLAMGGELARGTFPSAFRLTADVNAQIRNNVFEQNVTRFRASYDYHHNDHIGYFSFIERYTDTFMSIESRYEIGAGVSFGVNLWPRWADEPARAALSHVRSGETDGFPCLVRRVERSFYPDTSRTPDPCARLSPATAAPARFGSPEVSPRPTASSIDALFGAIPDLARALTAKQALVSLRVGVGVFSEFENAVIETGVSVLEPGRSAQELMPRSVQVPGMHRYRFLLRPTIRIQPLSSVAVNFIPSFKLPISNPRKSFDGELAYRMDWFVRIDWRLGADSSGSDRVKLVVKLDYYKNMGPPLIPDALAAAAALEQVVYQRTVASKKHRVVSLYVALDMGS